jgi:hypothetical protein
MSFLIWWVDVSRFTHVTVVPFCTVILAGTNAKFWIFTVIVPGTSVGVAAGVMDDGLLPVHPLTEIKVMRTTIRMAR